MISFDERETARRLILCLRCMCVLFVCLFVCSAVDCHLQGCSVWVHSTSCADLRTSVVV